MKNKIRYYFVAVFTILLGFVGQTDVIAGGLIDTSVERFLDANFTNSQSITNPWWTLPADHNFLYFAQDGEDCLWNLTEVMGSTSDLGGDFFGDYAGTNARIVLDRGWVDQGCTYGTDPAAFSDVSANHAEEATYDWYAQDSEKNIWYMGENTFNGVDFAGSFVAGCDGAEAGILLLGNPSKGDFYQQEFYADTAEDWGKVLSFKKKGALTCMETKEWSPLETGAIEHKVYCSDGKVGTLVRIVELKNKNVIWKLVSQDVQAPPPPTGPISPKPSCP